jgi:acyl-coenzyme A synthetase/AMP-(fatty) acid ligase
LYKRATLALHRFVLAGDFFNHLIKDKVTVIPLMPINITQMFDEDEHRLPNSKLLDNVRIITSSGGKVTPKMIADIEKYFKSAKFYSMHGLTEAFRSTYLEPTQLKIRPNSIGKPIPDVELYVINKEGYACAPREIGELIHRGSYIYKGFWNAPQETQERFKSIQILKNVINLEGQLNDEIVVASGDYVYKDEEGYFYFVSRHDDMIKTRGFRVSPLEIESVVYDNIKEVNQCAVLFHSKR